MKGKIFNAQEVQAMLNGSKVQFRKVIKHKDSSREICPYQVGQKIFAKESFCPVNDEQFGDKNWIDYRATPKYAESHPAGWDNEPESPDALKWKPAQHMKQEHSRLTLLIKEIKVERLADISEEDAIAEGFKNTFVGFQHPVYNPGRTANQDFEIFWNATHKKPEKKFEASPWVWCVSFEVINN